MHYLPLKDFCWGVPILVPAPNELARLDVALHLQSRIKKEDRVKAGVVTNKQVEKFN